MAAKGGFYHEFISICLTTQLYHTKEDEVTRIIIGDVTTLDTYKKLRTGQFLNSVSGFLDSKHPKYWAFNGCLVNDFRNGRSEFVS